MKRKLFCLLTLLLTVCSGAWADPTYKSDFTNNQIIWTTKSAVDDAITNGWMVKGGKVTGTKNLKNRLLIDPTTNEVSTSAQFTSDTNFYVEKAYNSTLSNDYSLYIYVTGVTRLYFYVWSNSTPDGRSMNIYLNGSNDASATITYPNESEPRNGYAYVDLTSSVNNVIRLSASNELELYAIKAQTPTELAISTHPTSAEYASGASAAALTVAATGGTKPYTYQWYSCADAEKSSPSALTSDDEIAKGSQTASYTPSTTATGYYYCKVTDSATPTSAEVESNVATITISAASAPTKPTITGGPAEAVAKNTAVTLTASSTGLPSPTYQWYSNTTAVATVDDEHEIDGATAATYSPSTAAIGTKYYYVVASNSEGSSTSDVVTVEVVGSNACELINIQFSNGAYGAISSLTEGAGTITVPYLSGESAPTVNESSIVISDNATKVVEGNTVTVTAEDGTTTGIYTITKTAFTPLEVTGDIETETFTAVPTWVYNPYGWDSDKGVKFAKDDNESNGTRRISLGNTRQYYFISAAQTLSLTSGTAGGRGINVYRNGVKLATPTATESTNNSIDIALDPSAPCMIMIESKGNNGDGGFTKYAVTAAVAKYDVNIAAMTNGSVTADVDEAAEDATVTLTVAPEDGYALSTLTVTKADESTVATSEVDATHYTFTMPAEAVTVSATFSFVIPGPSDPETVGGDAVTWDFSTSEAQEAAGTIKAEETNTLTATDGKTTMTYVAGGSDSYNSNGYIKPNGSTSNSNNRFFVIQISSNGKLGITTKSNNGDFVIKKAASASTTWNEASAFDPKAGITTVSDGVEVKTDIIYDSSKPYLVVGFPDGKRYIQKVTWTPASDDVTMTTSVNMDGWRSFVDATQAYTIKEGETSTKAYIVTSVGANVVLSEYDGIIYKDMPVLLKTDRNDRTIVLTKNADGAVGVGFYPYSTASAPAGVVYLDAPISARALSIVFEDEGETTSLREVRGLKADVRGDFYNLNGQRVAQPTKGLYIVNGRKVVIK